MRGSRSEPGDTRVAKNGYHYTRTEEKWRLTHHLVAEEKLGRELNEDERVVFRDGDKTNLDPSNIEVRRKTVATLKRKEAQLLARKDEIDAQLHAIHAQIEHKMSFGDEPSEDLEDLEE